MSDVMRMNANEDAFSWASISLAGLVHLVLLGFLWFGVQWQNRESTAVEAEVWDMTVRQAAQAEPIEPKVIVQEAEPVKVQRKEEEPDIALEQEKKRKLLEAKALKEERELVKKKELEKLAEEKIKKEKILKDEADKKKLAKENAIKEKLFADDLKRLNGQAVKANASILGDALKSTGNNRGDATYANLIREKIKSNNKTYVSSDNSSNNPTVEFQINLFPDGTLRGPVKLLSSSGIPAFDQAIASAIENSVPFPKEKSTGVAPPSFNYKHRMKD